MLLLSICEDFGEITDFEQLGKTLKKFRETANITLEQIQKETKIRSKYLSVIEKGDFSKIPGGEVYAKGFLRNYCKSVGIDYDLVLTTYKNIKTKNKNIENDECNKDMRKQTGHKIKKEKDVGFKLKTPEHRKFLKYIAVAVLLVILIAVFLRFNKNTDYTDTNPEQPPNISEEHNQQAQAEEDVESVENGFQSQQEERSYVKLIEERESDTVYEVVGKDIDLEFKVISDRCWISVKSDNSQDYEGTLVKGESRKFRANEVLYIRIGNPKVVSIVVNEEDIGVPGGDKPRNFTFQRRI